MGKQYRVAFIEWWRLALEVAFRGILASQSSQANNVSLHIRLMLASKGVAELLNWLCKSGAHLRHLYGAALGAG